MTRKALQTSIMQILDKFPKEKVAEVYKCLKDFEDEDPDQVKMTVHLNKILKEDRELLKRLAQ